MVDTWWIVAFLRSELTAAAVGVSQRASHVALSIKVKAPVIILPKYYQNFYECFLFQCFLDKFSAAKDKIAAAGSAAAESAAAAAQDFSQKASRVALDIKLKAPVIIVPQNSNSNNALMVDLGLITVKNQFEMPGKYSAEGTPAVLDKMNVQLSSMKLSRWVCLKSTDSASIIDLELVSFMSRCPQM